MIFIVVMRTNFGYKIYYGDETLGTPDLEGFELLESRSNWLASTSVWTNVIDRNVSFEIFAWYYMGVNGAKMLNSIEYKYGWDNAVRPVVELTSELPQGK